MNRIFVCHTNAIDDGTAIKVDTPHLPVAVFNVSGKFYAVSDRCSHGNASMSEGYIEADGTVECPLHAARFCLESGQALCQPATDPLQTFAVFVQDERVYVDVPEAKQ